MTALVSHAIISDLKTLDVKPPSPISKLANINYDDYLLKDAPSSLHYIPEFFSEEEEDFMMKNVLNVPESYWIRTEKQHKQEWGTVKHSNGDVEVVGKPLPEWSALPINLIMGINNGFANYGYPEFLRINEYPTGYGIHAHLDIDVPGRSNAIVTLKGTALLDFYHQDAKGETTDLESRYIGSVFMEPRSVLFISDKMFQIMHGIKEVTADLITDKVFNRPARLPIGSVVPRKLRYSLALTRETGGAQ